MLSFMSELRSSDHKPVSSLIRNAVYWCQLANWLWTNHSTPMYTNVDMQFRCGLKIMYTDTYWTEAATSALEMGNKLLDVVCAEIHLEEGHDTYAKLLCETSQDGMPPPEMKMDRLVEMCVQLRRAIGVHYFHYSNTFKYCAMMRTERVGPGVELARQCQAQYKTMRIVVMWISAWIKYECGQHDVAARLLRTIEVMRNDASLTWPALELITSTPTFKYRALIKHALSWDAQDHAIYWMQEAQLQIQKHFVKIDIDLLYELFQAHHQPKPAGKFDAKKITMLQSDTKHGTGNEETTQPDASIFVGGIDALEDQEWHVIITPAKKNK
jgi:hypothetical protein